MKDVSASSPASKPVDGKRHFSNPMYEAMGHLETEAEAEAARASSSSTVLAEDVDDDDNGSHAAMEPPSAVIAPSSITHQGSGVGLAKPKQRRELEPSSHDTGKDTQCLVEEGDSEC
jgi:hypothetical protein